MVLAGRVSFCPATVPAALNSRVARTTFQPAHAPAGAAWTSALAATQIANAFHNQLELPVLFYVLTILAWITRHADYLFVVMAWIFVLSRLGHAFIHTTSNDVRVRGAVFGVGAIVLALMWLIFMFRILLGLG